jgi:hypothetical protein
MQDDDILKMLNDKNLPFSEQHRTDISDTRYGRSVVLFFLSLQGGGKKLRITLGEGNSDKNSPDAGSSDISSDLKHRKVDG